MHESLCTSLPAFVISVVLGFHFFHYRKWEEVKIERHTLSRHIFVSQPSTKRFFIVEELENNRKHTVINCIFPGYCNHLKMPNLINIYIKIIFLKYREIVKVHSWYRKFIYNSRVSRETWQLCIIRLTLNTMCQLLCRLPPHHFLLKKGRGNVNKLKII